MSFTGRDQDKLQQIYERTILGEAKKIFVSAYWSGNTLKWRTEDGRMGGDPMTKKDKKDKSAVKKHLEKVLGAPVELDLIKEEKSKIDWNDVKEAMVNAAKDIHGKADMKTIGDMIDNVKKKNPKDTEDAIQIGINMMR